VTRDLLSQDSATVLPIAVRAFASPRRARPWDSARGESRRRRVRRYPWEALVFDTETLGGPAQRLLVLVWRLYRDRWDQAPGTTCIEEGIAYPDDLPEQDPQGLRVLRDYVDDPRNEAGVAPGYPQRVQVQPLSWWLDKRLYRYGFDHRNRCDVVGFNLPFDLGRVASHWAPARGYYRGGWSLGIWGRFDDHGAWHDLRYRRRLLMRAIDPRRTLFGWGSLTEGERDQPDWKGSEARFVDLHTLTFALTDKNLTLEGACAAFGDTYEKRSVRYGAIDPRLLRYAREDVEHTAILYRNCLAELRRHEGIDLEPHRPTRRPQLPPDTWKLWAWSRP
jgi:hypothetical protein